MNRRRFLGNLLIGTGAMALAPGLARARGVPTPAQAFAAGLERHPWLLGWSNAGAATLGPHTAQIEGKWPQALRGTLYRNGPALFERAGTRYEHWFDGDGMVHAWQIGAGGISHHARMVGTAKYLREQQIGRFVVPAAGTRIDGAEQIRNNDSMNTANTSVMRLGDRLFALWEGGSAIELDRHDLHTIGPVNWRDDLQAAPFSAHPLCDRDGSWWNFGSLDMLGGSGLLIWHIAADGRLAKLATISDGQNGYIHSFAMTERHLVFVLTPYRKVEGAAFFERMRFAEDLPCRIAVVAKDALDAPRWIDADFGMVYHHADAFEAGDEIVLRAVRHANAAAARSPMAAAMGGSAEGEPDSSELVELRIGTGSGRARWVSSGIRGVEFPTCDARAQTMRQSRIHVTTRTPQAIARYANAVSAIDLHRERIRTHAYGRAILAEEHLFIADPRSRRAGQGWLLGSLLDHAGKRSGLAVLDARRVEDGPLAIAWLPYAFPLGFHGCFSAAS
jgi:carotenoid cleavage dioxygenase-like enzyme